jgi:hypothetical protein
MTRLRDIWCGPTPRAALRVAALPRTGCHMKLPEYSDTHVHTTVLGPGKKRVHNITRGAFKSTRCGLASLLKDVLSKLSQALPSSRARQKMGSKHQVGGVGSQLNNPRANASKDILGDLLAGPTSRKKCARSLL